MSPPGDRGGPGIFLTKKNRYRYTDEQGADDVDGEDITDEK